MQKVTLGATGLRVSPVACGGIIEQNESQEAANRFVAEAVARGVNYFDIAPSYGDAMERLGAALQPYRRDVILACKTEKRDGKEAREDLERSLKLMKTDYFDVYQLHAVSTAEDIDHIFGDYGAMAVLQRAKDRGQARFLGITAHSESKVIEALALHDFDTVMFPMNWVMGLERGYGHRVARICRRKNKGFLAIKALAHRQFFEGEERKYPKGWCKTVYEDERLAVAALKYALSLGVNVLIPPGDFEQFSFVLGHIDECERRPLNDGDLAYLRQNLDAVREHQIFDYDM